MTDVAIAPRDATIEVSGEQVVLMADRALYWPRATTLLVADAHFGKAATFRAGGIFVPRGTTANALARLDDALARTRATRLIFLGDLLHAREGRSAETLRIVGEWRAAHPALRVVLVRGNHDRKAGDPPESLGIACADAPVLDGPFAFTHHPATIEGRYVIAGHVHPAVRLRGPGRQHERPPCFWIRRDAAVLPAFGDFTGVGDVDPVEGDRIFAVAGESVVSMPLPSRP
jgi:DNA ligase-associated metallophosphoesterase